MCRNCLPLLIAVLLGASVSIVNPFFQIPISAEAKTWYVASGGQGDGSGWDSPFGTITAGVTAAATGDEVWIASATYTESIDIRKGIALIGGFAGTETSREQRDWSKHPTTIQGAGVTVVEAHGAVLDGLSVTAGSSSGIGVSNSSLIIRHCTVSDNQYEGMDTWFSTLLIDGCTITGNKDGGISATQSSFLCEYSVFAENQSDEGGAVQCGPAAEGVCRSCVFVGNRSSFRNVSLYQSEDSRLSISNSVLWNPGTELGGNPIVTYCCVQSGWPGEGNIDALPLFADPMSGDFHILDHSPCIDSGTSTGKSFNGSAPDIGAFETPDGYTPGSRVHIPRIVHVSSNAAEGGDGATWLNAFPDLSEALANSSTSDEFWVAGGRYSGGIALEPNTRIYGGFSGVEDGRGERDWNANRTIIDASLSSGRGIIGADGCVLDGVRITGAQDTSGLSIYDVSTSLANCVIYDNVSDYGVLYCGYLGVLSVYNCAIISNKTLDGSAIWGGTESRISLFHCDVSGNVSQSAYRGAVTILSKSSSLCMQNCLISENDGWGISTYQPTAEFAIVNCSIISNSLGGISCGEARTAISNSILINPGPELKGTRFACRYSCVEGGAEGIGNIDLYPEFVRPWGWSYADWHLLPNSPCIDAGDPSPEFDDACLPPGLGTSRNDMGAYGGPYNCVGGAVPELPTHTPTPTAQATPTPTVVSGVGEWRVYQ